MTDTIGYARSGAAIFEFSGPGAVACLQGLVSSDIEKAGANSVTYGAVLTPKGMIIADGWIIRAGERLFMVTEQSARAALLEVFRKALPPRLARVTDRSEAWSIMRVFGAREDARGHVRVDGDTITAHVPASAWFDELRLGPADAMDHAAAELEAEGASALSPLDVTRRRVERGWPLLGAEIDDRTLVQEVRFDEHGGVSYEKGCYVGQETVARLHFRGHTNRNLRGLVFEGDAEPAGERVELDGKDVGRIGTTVNATGRRIGLALVRREVADGARVVAGGIPATVVPLPFGEAADR
jgi:folate-binding protein YgfZ